MKKITKFLDSVMGGIKRTCVAKALAVFAVASVTISSFAQTTETTQSPVINGVEDFVGLTPAQVKAAVVDENYVKDPDKKFNDKTKVLFLYNVKTGKFLNVGGYWGTCASLHDYGKALWVNDVNDSNLRFAVDNINDTGHWLGYAFAAADERDRDVYIDRGSAADKISSSTWTIVSTGDKVHNTVKIFTTIISPPANFSDQVGKKYYLSANPNNHDTGVSCSAYLEGTNLDGNDEWRIFSYDYIYEKQKNGIVNNMKNALELSFRLKSPTFDRHDSDIQYWKTFNFVNGDQDKAGFAKFGLEKYYVTSALWDKTEAEGKWETGYKFNGKAFSGVDDYQCYLAKYFCGSITGKCGILYQNITITLPGTYVIECKGYSNTTKAKLFAGVLDPTDNNKMVDGTMNSTVFNQVSDMSADEQDALHTADHNMDYAGKALFDNRKYMNSVVLTVPESAFAKNPDGTTNPATIRFGVMTGVYNKDKSKVVDPDANEWTVFDDFRLQYASTQTSQDLILDEKRDNLNYLYNTTNTYKNTTLHLNKTLTKKKWNSLVLPVSLTKGQLRSTFGANTRLAQLNTLTSTSIEFKSVKLDEMGDDEVALTAYMPYIIFPEKEMDANNTKDYTASLTVDGQTKKVYVPAGHYNIAKVTMVDFSKIDKSNWTTKLYGGDNTIKAYGTFARTFGKFSSYDEATGVYGKVTVEGMEDPIIPGRPRLEHSYFFDKGNMYHSTGRPRGLHGFSCWFEPVSGGTPQNVQLTLDGVTPNGTTGIEDILADYEQPVSRFANGIYNLNGQLVKQGNSTAGLPSGMYIVNGKKCIVR